jgi:hypothetical protein
MCVCSLFSCSCGWTWWEDMEGNIHFCVSVEPLAGPPGLLIRVNSFNFSPSSAVLLLLGQAVVCPLLLASLPDPDLCPHRFQPRFCLDWLAPLCLTGHMWLPHFPDDGGSKDLWNVSKLIPFYMALQPRRRITHHCTHHLRNSNMSQF